MTVVSAKRNDYTLNVQPDRKVITAMECLYLHVHLKQSDEQQIIRKLSLQSKTLFPNRTWASLLVYMHSLTKYQLILS